MKKLMGVIVIACLTIASFTANADHKKGDQSKAKKHHASTEKKVEKAVKVTEVKAKK